MIYLQSGFLICALIIIASGISQIKEKKPVGFLNGRTSQPPAAKDITDVEAWNKKHGTLWIGYGCFIVLCWILGLLVEDSTKLFIPYFAGLILPLPIMAVCHKKLVKKYHV